MKKVRFGYLLLVIGIAISPPVQAGGCVGASDAELLGACSAELTKEPDNKKLRLYVVQRLLDLEKYGEAVRILEAGLHRGTDDDFERALVNAKSLLAEQNYVKKHQAELAAAAAANSASSNRLNQIRCSNLGGERALAACDAWLKIGGPGEAEIQQRRGDLLAEAGRKSEALIAYRRALLLSPGNTQVSAAIAALEPNRSPVPAKAVPKQTLVTSNITRKTTVAAVAAPKPAPTVRPVAVVQPRSPSTSDVKIVSYSNAAIAPGVTY